MQTGILLLLLGLTAVRATAQNQTDTDELLGAPNVRRFIQLWPDFTKNAFYFSLDTDSSRKYYKSLLSCPTVGVPRRDREVALTIRFFNPLQYTIRTTDTLLEDPSYANISRFATSLTDFLKLLPSIPESQATNSNVTKTEPGKTAPAPLLSSVVAKYRLKAEGSFSTASAEAASLSAPVNISLASPVPSASLTKPVPTTALQHDGSVAAVSPALKTLTDYINSVDYDELAEWKYLWLSGRIGCLDLNTDVMKQLADVNQRYYNGRFRLRVIEALDKLSQPDNVRDFKRQNNQFKKTIDTLKRINEDNQQVLRAFDDAISGDIYKLLLNRPNLTTTTATKAGKANTEPIVNQSDLCLAFITYSQIVFKRMVRACLDGQRKRDQILDLADQLTKEIAETENLIDETFGDNDGGYHPQNALILGRYTISDKQMHDVGILIRKRSFNFNTEPPTVGEAGEKLYGHIKIRGSQTLIPEFSFGLYFTNLMYPVYSTKTLTTQQATDLNATQTRPGNTTYTAGQSIIDEVVQQPVPIVAAAMLNLTLNAFNGLAHPMVQLGVGTGKTLPTFLLGGGIRLRGPVPIMISAGAIWNWKKQLNSLRPNQVVEGQAQLENDLLPVFDPKPRFYIGLQMHL